MNEATIALIISLIPVAEKLVFEVGGKLIELDTANVTKEDMLKALEKSKSQNWPVLSFTSPASK